MRRNLRISGRSGGEEHKHRVASAGGVLAACVMAAVNRVFLIEVMPAVLASANEDFMYERGTYLRCAVDCVGNLTVFSAENRFYIGCVKAV